MSPQDHLKLYEQKLGLQRFEEVEPLISADATFWFSDGTHRGLKDIRSAFEKKLARASQRNLLAGRHRLDRAERYGGQLYLSVSLAG